MAVAKCNLCDDTGGKAFRTPWDQIGKALMEEHLKEHEAARLAAEKEAKNVPSDTDTPTE